MLCGSGWSVHRSTLPPTSSPMLPAWDEGCELSALAAVLFPFLFIVMDSYPLEPWAEINILKLFSVRVFLVTAAIPSVFFSFSWRQSFKISPKLVLNLLCRPDLNWGCSWQCLLLLLFFNMIYEYSHMYVSVWACVHGGWRWLLGVFLDHSLFYFLMQGFLLTPELVDVASFANQLALGIAYLHFLSAGITDRLPCLPSFCV